MGAKINSIQRLRSLGLNVPDIRVLRSREDVYNFIKSDYEGWEKISIRTDNKEGKEIYKRWGLPFFPNLTKEEVQEKIKILLPLIEDKIDIIMAKGINPGDALMSGKYMRGDREILEYVLGSSTVRDIDKEIPNSWKLYGERMPHNLLYLQLPINLHYSLFHAVEQADRAFRAPYILEFSVYPHGVGNLRNPLIFWEVIEKSNEANEVESDFKRLLTV